MPAAGKPPRGKRRVSLFEVLAAAFLDFVLADPWHWPHPVQAMGGIISGYAKVCIQLNPPPWMMRLLGILLAGLLIGGSGLFSAAVIDWVHRGLGDSLGKGLGSWLGGGLEVIWLASCFAGRSLRRAARDVLVPLAQNDLATARQRLAQYVGRDTDDLSRSEILRAVLETVSENATDGVLAPLFYALLGALLGLGSVPLAMAYKAASTLDSMVGYRRAPYTHLGWFSARLEDGLTWVPCRLMVLTIGVLSGRPRFVWRVCGRDAIADPSPNAGWSECAYAAALGVQVGGENVYKGEVIQKPKLGIAERPIEPVVIEQALNLTRYSFLLWLGIGILGLWL
ncbi:MAG: adenosylcobinamide-phosphate synthase CbiB [Cyanobacteria bacterium P01_G01_bin.38]